MAINFHCSRATIDERGTDPVYFVTVKQRRVTGVYRHKGNLIRCHTRRRDLRATFGTRTRCALMTPRNEALLTETPAPPQDPRNTPVQQVHSQSTTFRRFLTLSSSSSAELSSSNGTHADRSWSCVSKTNVLECVVCQKISHHLLLYSRLND